MTEKCDAAIIGAGPYGLSAAAHLRGIRGLDVRVFGETMSFWQRHMPAGMVLRSPYVASHLSGPGRACTLDAYAQARGNHLGKHVPLERFIDYGRWFQRQLVPDVDSRKVDCVIQDGRGFSLALADGQQFSARRLIVAGGIQPFAQRPAEFREWPPSRVSHASEHDDLSKFTGQRVAVIGGGQSALESAALLHESGASVEVIVRAPFVRWLQLAHWMHQPPFGPLLYAWPDVGPAGVSHLVARPNLFRLLPRSAQDRLAPRSIRSAGANWLKGRCAKVRISTNRHTVSAAPFGDEVELTLNDGARRRVDHVLLGTGYRVDVSKYPYLSRELLASFEWINGYPKLNSAFETTLPGLHFLGAPAAWSFGPLMRFVAGTEFAAVSLARGIRRQRGSR